jgi:hypothetical protein
VTSHLDLSQYHINILSNTDFIEFEYNLLEVFELKMPWGLQCMFLCVPQSAIESLFGASMTGIAYSLFAGQPLTILGSTGPVLVFEKILYKFCK